jgi:plasmid stability protein
MATLTVRNLDDEIVCRLRIRAAEQGRSAEAEHRAILHSTLIGSGPSLARQQIIERLAEFRRRTAGRASTSAADLLRESRDGRMQEPTGTGDES